MTISTAVPSSAVARALGVKTEFKDLRSGSTFFLPQRVALIGQAATSAVFDSTKRTIASANEAAQLYGFGSPIHLAALQLLPINGDGVSPVPVTVYPLGDEVGSAAAAGDITPAGTQTELASYQVVANGIKSQAFTIDAGDSVADITAAITAAVNGELDMPITATDNTTDVIITAKWAGESGNDLQITIEGSTTAGTTFAFTQPTGGAVNPDIQPALDQVGEVWETMFLNCLNISDTDTLDLLSQFGEGRWGALTRKPMVAFTGNTIADVAAATAISDARTTDRVNAQLVAPGSVELPFVVAARQLSRIAATANSNPPQDYGSQLCQGIEPGADGDQWDYSQRDQAVKAGSSTVEVRGGVVSVADVVTFYHPLGDPLPAYRYVVDIVKLQNIIFNYSVTFSQPEWDGAPLLPDNQATRNPTAKKPKMAKAASGSIVDGLSLDAIISDPEFTKANTLVEIDSANPKRLNLSVTFKLAGNVNIISVDLNFGFNFGGTTVVA